MKFVMEYKVLIFVNFWIIIYILVGAKDVLVLLFCEHHNILFLPVQLLDNFSPFTLTDLQYAPMTSVDVERSFIQYI